MAWGDRSGLEIFRVGIDDTVHGGSEGGDGLVAGVDGKGSRDVLRRFRRGARLRERTRTILVGVRGTREDGGMENT